MKKLRLLYALCLKHKKALLLLLLLCAFISPHKIISALISLLLMTLLAVLALNLLMCLLAWVYDLFAPLFSDFRSLFRGQQ